MLQFCNMLFSFFVQTFLIFFAKQQQFNVQALLDKKDKTRYWLVKQMGTDYATVNKICDNASKSVRIDTLERLMKALDCEVQDLFTEE